MAQKAVLLLGVVLVVIACWIQTEACFGGPRPRPPPRRYNPCRDLPSCPGGQSTVQCFVDPCRVAEGCPRRPNARCRSSYCAGCHAVWCEGDRDVSDMCGRRGPPDIQV